MRNINTPATAVSKSAKPRAAAHRPRSKPVSTATVKSKRSRLKSSGTTACSKAIDVGPDSKWAISYQEAVARFQLKVAPEILDVATKAHLQCTHVDEVIESIRVNGQRVPVVLDHDDRIIDGVARMIACHELGIEPKCVRLAGNTSSTDAWMAYNRARRHLSVGERSLLAFYEAQAAGVKLGNNDPTKLTQAAIAESHGLSTRTLQRTGALLSAAANVDMTAQVTKRLAGGASPGTLLREMKAHGNRANVNAIAAATPKALATLTGMQKSGAKFDFLYVDCPWDYGADEASSWSAAPHKHYPVMPLQDIKALGHQVKAICAPDSLVWFWVPNSLIESGLEVLAAWGFNMVTVMAWVKRSSPPTKGAVSPQHETLIVGMRGNGLPKAANEAPAPSVHEESISRHSAKPAWFAEQIERMYPHAAKLEMFSRQPRANWHAWGNEA